MTPRPRIAPEPEHVMRLTEPDDVLRAIPYLLGFHPSQSLVLVGLDGPIGGAAKARTCITVRLDLTDIIDHPPAALSAVEGAVRAGTKMVFGAVFCADLTEAVSWAPALVPIEAQLADRGVGVANWLFTGPDGWMAGDLDDEGVDLIGPFPHLSDTRVEAEATYAGLVARSDRTELADLLAPDALPRRDRLRPELDRACIERVVGPPSKQASRRRGEIRAMFGASRSLPLLEARQVVRFGAALTDIEVRDACWLAIESSKIDGEGLWRELGRRLPDEYRPAPLFLFGWSQWRSGNGALASMAAEAALICNPSYTAAQLLAGTLQHGLDPRRTPRLRKGA